jgi:hypothetical protein
MDSYRQPAVQMRVSVEKLILWLERRQSSASKRWEPRLNPDVCAASGAAPLQGPLDARVSHQEESDA